MNKILSNNVVNLGYYEVILYVKIIDKNLLLYEDDSSKRKEQAFRLSSTIVNNPNCTFVDCCNKFAKTIYATIQEHFPDGENAFEKFESMFPTYEDGEIYGKD